jgi:type IV pilus assembly protein PilA
LIELMIVVAIIGLLAAVALPNYSSFQLKSNTGEVKSNLAAIITAEEAYFAEYGRIIATTAEPSAIPGAHQASFSSATPGCRTLGFSPEGRVYFSYGVGLTLGAGTPGYTIDAGADLDGDSVNQYWAYAKVSSAGVRATAIVGCDESAVELEMIYPCTPESGQSVF